MGNICDSCDRYASEDDVLWRCPDCEYDLCRDCGSANIAFGDRSMSEADFIQHHGGERRLAENGLAYTCEEFRDYYASEGWRKRWNNSSNAAAGEKASEELSESQLSTHAGASSGESSDEWGSTEATCAQCGSVTACSEGGGGYTHGVYCDECWQEWHGFLSSVPRVLPQVAEPLEQQRVVPSQGHFDFIEVGTSDWCTITQYCAGDCENGSLCGAQIRTSLQCLQDARGLAVEPVGAHLAELPQLPRVIPVEAALGEFSGKAVLYYISPENIAKHLGQYYSSMDLHRSASARGSIDVMWYAKSMSSVGKPHPELETMLRNIDRMDLLEERLVQVYSWGDLCALYGVSSVDCVQLDCEGMDCAVIRGLLAHCRAHPRAHPREIWFEANDLTESAEVEETLQALAAHGYSVTSRDWQNITVERGIVQAA